MSREKQIEEIAKVIDQSKYNMCITKEHPAITVKHHSKKIAEALYNAGYRKQEWISVEERLPEENVYVLIAVGNSIQVARIIKGISEEKREKMKNGELPDPEESCFAADKIITLRRSQLYRSGDVWGNNLVPYYWKANGGPMEWFGQNITHWMPLPEAPKMKGGGE